MIERSGSEGKLASMTIKSLYRAVWVKSIIYSR